MSIERLGSTEWKYALTEKVVSLRALDEGGMIWESSEDYETMDEATQEVIPF